MIIRSLSKNSLRLSDGTFFAPPEEHQLDYADSEEGVYSYASKAGFWRTWVWGGQTNSEFVPNSYFVKLDNLKIEKVFYEKK